MAKSGLYRWHCLAARLQGHTNQIGLSAAYVRFTAVCRARRKIVDNAIGQGGQQTAAAFDILKDGPACGLGLNNPGANSL